MPAPTELKSNNKDGGQVWQEDGFMSYNKNNDYNNGNRNNYYNDDNNNTIVIKLILKAIIITVIIKLTILIRAGLVPDLGRGSTRQTP